MTDRSNRTGFLDASGEMGRLVRAFDWDQTSLGPAEQWSNSLRTTLGILLNSRHPMFLWWGCDLVQFYNDGYRPSLGADLHPKALGARGREFWVDIWSTIGPQIDAVMTRGESTWHNDQLVPIFRNGRYEEVYWTYGYSPVHDDDGTIGGTLVVVQEQTARVIGERRLSLLRDLAALSSVSQTEEQVWAGALSTLGGNRHDLPWTRLYAVGDDGLTSRLIEEARAPAAGAVMGGLNSRALDHRMSAIRRVVDGGLPVLATDNGEALGDAADSPEPPQTAWLVPIRRPGSSHPYGVLVAGLSPRLAFDDNYRDFVSLVADQLATSLTNARTHEEERRRAESLAQVDRAKTIFFSNVSHEFRTPLTLMLGPLDDMLNEDGRLPADCVRIDVIRRNGQRLLKLVNTLLDFARIEAGRAEATYEPTDLSALTSDLASAFRSTVECAGLELDVKCPPLPEPIYVDPGMWEQIVLNLISNAFKFTFAGSIVVSLQWCGTHVELLVSDTGVGISDEELPHIFERFHRVQEACGRTNEGSGIGLALVEELVKMHGGSTRVSSTVGEGSAFTVTVRTGTAHLAMDRVMAHSTSAPTPRDATAYVEEALQWLPGVLDEAAEQAATLSPSGMRAYLGSSIAHILVVDDNADMRRYIRHLLGARWSVDVAADGREALAAAKHRQPDLVITDVMMPSLDGFALLRELRADDQTARVPVILLTARAGEEARIDGWNAGAEDYLAKPFSARELIARVEAQLLKATIRSVEEIHAHRLADVFRHAPVGIAILRGPQHVHEFANAPYLELVAHRAVIGKTVRDALPELANQGIGELLDGVYASGQPHIGRALRVVLTRGEDGSSKECFLDFVYQPLFAEHGKADGIAVVVHDVTELATARREAERMAELTERNAQLALALAERTALERARNAWLGSLMSAQEDERRRVARELHDEMGQHLTGLMLGLHELESTGLDRAGSVIARLKDVVSEINRGTHRLARDLRPSALDDFGLMAALGSYVDEWSKETGIAADFSSINCVGRLPLPVETTLYRIVQEALTNVARHAHAHTASVVVDCRPELVVAIIEDDGLGFEAAVETRSHGVSHFGLVGIRERAALLGGSMRIESARGGGTSLFVTLPIAPQEDSAG